MASGSTGGKNNDEGLGANHKFKKKREKLVSEDNQ